MSIAKLLALFNHPVTQAILDTGQYVVQRHIMPAVNRSATPPSEEEMQHTASEYAFTETGDIADAEYAEVEQDTERNDDEKAPRKTRRRTSRMSGNAPGRDGDA